MKTKLPAMRLKDLSIGGLIVALSITTLNAEVITTHVFTNPLGSNFKSTDNGGTLPAIDAYKDGIGVIVLDNLGQNIQIDNSVMNTLVYKYGEAAKESGSTIVDEVMYGSGSTNTKDKSLVGSLTVNGASCNDGNAVTNGETWLNGVCQGGVSTNGTLCDDNNVMTINDIYTNGVCSGTLTVNGTTCSDGNSATVGEKWLNGVCTGGVIGTLAGNGLIYDNYEGGLRKWADAGIYCASKGMRLPTIEETTARNSLGGVPHGNGHAWTSSYTTDGIDYKWTWNEISSYSYWIGFNDALLFRCVK